MLATPFLTLLNPALALIFAAAFLLLWRYQPGRRYLALLAISQIGLAAAFLLQYYSLPFGAPLTRLLSNALFLGCVVAVAAAISQRYERRPRLMLQGAIALAACGLQSWFIVLSPDIFGRIYTINFAIGAMLLIIAHDIRLVQPVQKIDRCLYAVFVFNAILLFVRTIVAVHWGDGITDSSSLFGSVYWIVVNFSHAIVSLVSVLTVMAAVVLDALADLKAKGETDSLSGLLNRRGFEEAAGRVLETSLRRPLPTSLIIADIDRFKSINDEFGHHTGDKVIGLFAGVMCEAMRGHPVGRIGGEEFAVVVRGADLQTARLMAEGARIAFPVVAAPGRLATSGRRLTASFGVAEWRPGETYEELLGRADGALYRAKKAGRDRVKTPAEGASQSIKGVKSRA